MHWGDSEGLGFDFIATVCSFDQPFWMFSGLRKVKSSFGSSRTLREVRDKRGEFTGGW